MNFDKFALFPFKPKKRERLSPHRFSFFLKNKTKNLLQSEKRKKERIGSFEFVLLEPIIHLLLLNMAQVNDDKKPMDAAATANYKQLKIQSGALNRYTKELNQYIQEVADLTTERDKMRKTYEEKRNDEKEDDKVVIKLKSEIKNYVCICMNIRWI